jgi:hypothetical protein
MDLYAPFAEQLRFEPTNAGRIQKTVKPHQTHQTSHIFGVNKPVSSITNRDHGQVRLAAKTLGRRDARERLDTGTAGLAGTDAKTKGQKDIKSVLF